VNNWTQPVPAFWPEGTTPYDSRSVDTPLISTNTIPGATYYCQIGPFLPVSTQNVIQVDFCFRYTDGTWNNNNGADWHITILPKEFNTVCNTTSACINKYEFSRWCFLVA
jgi:hypothetical protein